MKKLRKRYKIEQPNGSPLAKDKDIVCRLKKELYGLKQAPRSLYPGLERYLLSFCFNKGNVDINMCFKKKNHTVY